MTQQQKQIRTHAELVAGMTSPVLVQARIDRLLAKTSSDPARYRRQVRELEALTLALLAYLGGR
jgi:TPP-dependent pyruvate/acetoin dehydrogenase alpha subunit